MIVVQPDPTGSGRLVAMSGGAVQAVVAPLDVPAFAKRMIAAGMPCDWRPAAPAVEAAKARFARDVAGLQTRLQKGPLSKLFPYQRAGARFLAERPRALLADSPGLGKSSQTLAALRADAAVLVVCPASAKGVWLRETARWRPDLEPFSPEHGFVWPDPGQVAIVTYDQLPIPEPIPEDGIDRAFREARGEPAPMTRVQAPPDVCLVGDEIHLVKGSYRTVRRAKAFRAISEAVRGNGGSAWGLSATPLLNTAQELWNVLDALGLAIDAFGSKQTFRDLFHATLVTKHTGRGGEIKSWVFPDPRKTPFEEGVVTRLRRVMLRREMRQVLPELPSTLLSPIPVTIDPILKKEIEDLADKEKILERVAAGEDLDKLIGGPAASVARQKMAAAKIDAVVEMANSLQEAGTPMLVFSAHRAPVEAFARRKGWGVIHAGITAKKRTQLEDKFQKGELVGIAGTIQSMGVALTLTRAAHVLFVDRVYTPALNDQAVGRALRIGQTQTVIVYDFQLDLPVERRVREILALKQATICASVEAAASKETES